MALFVGGYWSGAVRACHWDSWGGLGRGLIRGLEGVDSGGCGGDGFFLIVGGGVDEYPNRNVDMLYGIRCSESWRKN